MNMLPCKPCTTVFNTSSSDGSAEATVAASFAAWSRSRIFGRCRWINGQDEGSAVILKNKPSWNQAFSWGYVHIYIIIYIYSQGYLIIFMHLMGYLMWDDSIQWEKWWNTKFWATLCSDEPKWINTGQKNPQKHGGLNNQGLDLPSGNLT
jgi:hypothetical protein